MALSGVLSSRGEVEYNFGSKLWQFEWKMPHYAWSRPMFAIELGVTRTLERDPDPESFMSMYALLKR